MGAPHVGDAAIEALDHAVGLWGPGLDETMLDAVGSTDPIEGMVAGRPALAGGAEAAGELLAVIGEQRGGRAERLQLRQVKP